MDYLSSRLLSVTALCQSKFDERNRGVWFRHGCRLVLEREISRCYTVCRTFSGLVSWLSVSITREFRTVRQFPLQIHCAYFLGEFYFYDVWVLSNTGHGLYLPCVTSSTCDVSVLPHSCFEPAERELCLVGLGMMSIAHLQVWCTTHCFARSVISAEGSLGGSFLWCHAQDSMVLHECLNCCSSQRTVLVSFALLSRKPWLAAKYFICCFAWNICILDLHIATLWFWVHCCTARDGIWRRSTISAFI